MKNYILLILLVTLPCYGSEDVTPEQELQILIPQREKRKDVGIVALIGLAHAGMSALSLYHELSYGDSYTIKLAWAATGASSVLVIASADYCLRYLADSYKIRKARQRLLMNKELPKKQV